MKKSTLLKILISLTLTMSGRQLRAEAGVDATKFLTEKSANPSGWTCFDKWEIESLANYKKQCEKDKDELIIFSSQYDKCMGGNMCEEEKSNARIILFSSIVMSLAIGFTLGARGN